MDAPSQTPDCVSWASSIKTRIDALQQHASQDLKKNRTSSKRQLDSVRAHLSKIVEELQRRNENMVASQAILSQQTEDLDRRQAALEVFEEALQQLVVNAASPASSIEGLTQSLPETISGAVTSQLTGALSAALVPNLTTELTAKLGDLIQNQVPDVGALFEEVSDKIVLQISDLFPSMLLPSLTVELSARLRDLIQNHLPDMGALSEEVLDKAVSKLSDVFPNLLMPKMAIEISSQLGEVIEHQFAAIDASLRTAYESLADRFPKSDDSAAQLRELRELAKSLEQREAEMERLRSESLDKLREAEQRSERTAAQRKSIARTLRQQQRALRTEAERAKLVLEQTQLLQTLRTESESAETVQLYSDLAAAQQEIAELKNTLADSEKQVDSLITQIDDIDHALQVAQQSQAAADSELASLRKTFAESEALLTHTRQSSAETLAQNAKSVAELESELKAGSEMRSSLEMQLADAIHALETPLAAEASRDGSETLIGELRDEINELRISLAAARNEATSNSATVENKDKVVHRLKQAEVEVLDLRTQNSDLASQVARLQICVTKNHGPQPHLANENLCWEERKRLMIQQLEAETDNDAPDSKTKRIEVEEILRTTEAEIMRRDREITELRSLVEQQSNARDGMAVGAAAIAQLIESDDLILQEREKLRGIQQEWEQKLRQAEIELSMERAKLGRERSQLEERLRELENQPTASSQVKSDDGKKEKTGRKWLDRLGLKEDK